MGAESGSLLAGAPSRSPWRPWACLALAVMAAASVEATSRVKVAKGGGYEGVVVGVSPDVRQDPRLIDRIKDAMRDASKHLFNISNHKIYFRNITIVLPKYWTMTGNVYNATTAENFKESDIRVAPENSIYGDQPYTLQMGECGHPGLYTHVTPAYLTHSHFVTWWGPRGQVLTEEWAKLRWGVFGVPGQVLAEEWAKLRWGVFDEVGFPSDPRFPLFYSAGRNDTRRPTLCSREPLPGTVRNDTLRSAFVFHKATSLGHAGNYCTSETHIIEAPNKQNTYCHGGSIWSVIHKHSDYKASPGPGVEWQEPTVRVVREISTCFSFFLDNTASASDLLRQSLALRRWVMYDVSNGTFVTVLNPWTNRKVVNRKIVNQDTRLKAALEIAKMEHGNHTSNSSHSLTPAVMALDWSNGVLVALAGGRGVAVEESIARKIKRDIRVVVITHRPRILENVSTTKVASDQDLRVLAGKTGGLDLVVPESKWHLLSQSLRAALQYEPSVTVADTTTEIYEAEANDSKSDSFYVDRSMGRDLTFLLYTDDLDQVTNASLISPSSSLIPGRFDNVTLTWSITLPEAEAGEWQWQAEVEFTKTYHVRVTSRTRTAQDHPIAITSWLNQPAYSVNATQLPILYGEVRRGPHPFLNASVRAWLLHPNGSEDWLVLSDDGKNADTVAGDGIYSRFLTQFASNDYYVLQITAVDNSSVAGRAVSTSIRKRRRVDSSNEQQDNELIKTTPRGERDKARPPQAQLGEDIARPPSQEDTARPSQEDIARPPSQEDIARPPSQEDIARPPSQEDIARPPSQEDIARPPSQEDTARPSQEDTARPPSQEDPSNNTFDDSPPRVTEQPDYCCGSVVPSERVHSPDTERFARKGTVLSLQVNGVTANDTRPPCRVMDLRVVAAKWMWYSSISGKHTFCLSATWTAPGDDLDVGTVTNYTFLLSPNIRDVIHYPSATMKEEDVLEVSLDCHSELRVEGGTAVDLSFTWSRLLDKEEIIYFSLVSRDEAGNASPVSRVAYFTAVFLNDHKSMEQLKMDLVMITASIVTLAILLATCYLHREHKKIKTQYSPREMSRVQCDRTHDNVNCVTQRRAKPV
ncbi:calcium-activated chloride channel regulator 1 [Procambarus clarkii]|uniref:calcium-activated chloride channel regulator 1 n=1 Tax=Procambarus clarkii TaxID=6728 RepID=UPI0037433808